MLLQEFGVHHATALHQCEVAATEAYQQALEKLNGIPGALDLLMIRDDHREATRLLRQRMPQHHVIRAHDAAGWDAWHKLLEDSEARVSQADAIAALKDGEMTLMALYQHFLADTPSRDDDRACCEMLLRQAQDHCATLDRMVNTQV